MFCKVEGRDVERPKGPSRCNSLDIRILQKSSTNRVFAPNISAMENKCVDFNIGCCENWNVSHNDFCLLDGKSESLGVVCMSER